DGIRYRNVTGVQTCALPISSPRFPSASTRALFRHVDHQLVYVLLNIHPRALPSCPIPSETMPMPAPPWTNNANENHQQSTIFSRSEERRVGKECRARLETSD